MAKLLGGGALVDSRFEQEQEARNAHNASTEASFDG